MAAASKTRSLVKDAANSTRAWERLWPGLKYSHSVLVAFFLLFWAASNARADDSYGTTLDKRFSPSTPSAEAQNASVTALENGIRQQAQQMSQLAQPESTASTEGFEHFFLVVFGIVGALVLGVIGLIVFRRWNRWMDNEAAKRDQAFNALAEEPLMAEFLRTLNEQIAAPINAAPQTSPVVVALPVVSEAQAPPALAQTAAHAPTPEPAPKQPGSIGQDLAGLRADFHQLGRTTEDPARIKILHELVRQMESAKEHLGLPHLRSALLLATAMHGLLKQLSIKSSNITPSALRTAASAMDLLERLCTHPPRPNLATAPPVRMLAVDDDPISLRAVTMALKKAFNDSEAAPDGQSALALALKNPYDVFFLDIEMPGMDGFELCSKIRETALHRATPIVFVTSHSGFDSRAKSALVGANDLIAKPFLTFEITVKALTLVLRARQENEGKHAQGETAMPGAGTAVAERPTAVTGPPPEVCSQPVLA